MLSRLSPKVKGKFLKNAGEGSEVAAKLADFHDDQPIMRAYYLYDLSTDSSNRRFVERFSRRS